MFNPGKHTHLYHKDIIIFGMSISLTLSLLFIQSNTLMALAGHGGEDQSSQYINWSSLGLTQDQESEIDRLDSQWKRIYTDVYPQILRDKAELRRLLNSPQSNEHTIMELQSRIQNNEQRLRQEATRTFLGKKGQLNSNQKVRLQQMMGE